MMTEYKYRLPEPYAVPDNSIILDDTTGKVFDKIYQDQYWSSNGDGSGGDSRPEIVSPFFDIFTKILDDNKVTSIADFGCGSHYIWKDYNWSDNIQYNGYDVSSIALEKARNNCKKESFLFHKLESGLGYNDIPKHDLILAKDVLCHWNENDGHEFIRWSKNNFKITVVAGIVQIHLTKEIEETCDQQFIFTTTQEELYGVWVFYGP